MTWSVWGFVLILWKTFKLFLVFRFIRCKFFFIIHTIEEAILFEENWTNILSDEVKDTRLVNRIKVSAFKNIGLLCFETFWNQYEYEIISSLNIFILYYLFVCSSNNECFVKSRDFLSLIFSNCWFTAIQEIINITTIKYQNRENP